MTYPNEFYKLTWGGLIDNKDIWVNSLSLTPTDLGALPFQASLDTIADRFFTEIANLYVDNTAGMCNFNTLQWCKIVKVGVDGKYIGEPGVHFEAGNGRVSTRANTNRTPTDTLVVSLLTAASRGRAHRGRLYPPAFPIATDANGFVTQAAIDTYSTTFANFLKALRKTGTAAVYVPGLPLNQDEWNIQVMSKVGNGVSHEVTSIEVGNVFDVQRRRRNRIAEAYTPQSL